MWERVSIAARLAFAALVLARHGMPLAAGVRQAAGGAAGGVTGLAPPGTHVAALRRRAGRLAQALNRLGPSFIKLGQFLATRPDLVGTDMARGLSTLQDRLPPFPTEVAAAEVMAELGRPLTDLFSEFGAPAAAASIAQVHPALAPATEGMGARKLAVKVLRPGVERRFTRDVRGLRWAAGVLQSVNPDLRRLGPVRAVDELALWVRKEMDLRLEAAAAAEMGENTADDEGFRVPEVDWVRSSARVLTTEWVDGVTLHDRDALIAAGHDPRPIAATLMRSFLLHALRDGFFHADMHPGNLFVDADGCIVAVDFGIMGRLDRESRATMAEILFGIVTRDYDRAAQAHFDAGYVPKDQSRADFAQALRAIGEPIWGRPARDTSMGKLLAQLFDVTRIFHMRMRPELLLLQKTMLVVEGVARDLDPGLNMWEVARPVLEDWIANRLGPEARLREAADTAADLGRIVARAPEMLEKADRAATLLTAALEEGGMRLHPETARAIAKAEARTTRASRWALVAVALAATAVAAAAAGLLAP